jgi:hypothetical protein
MCKQKAQIILQILACNSFYHPATAIAFCGLSPPLIASTIDATPLPQSFVPIVCHQLPFIAINHCF